IHGEALLDQQGAYEHPVLGCVVDDEGARCDRAGHGHPCSSARLRRNARGRTSGVLLRGLLEDSGREAIRVGDDALTYEALRGAAGAVAERVSGMTRVAVVADNSLQTCVAVVGALAAGVPIVPINPKAGTREREHIMSDSAPDMVLDDVDLGAAGDWP